MGRDAEGWEDLLLGRGSGRCVAGPMRSCGGRGS